MNETFKASTIFNCYRIDETQISNHQFDPKWRQNAISCRVLLILQQMFNLNISYIVDTDMTDDKNLILFPHLNETFDIYVQPMAITAQLLNNASPVETVFIWRFGFILRRKYSGVMRPYYSLPFSKSVWCCFYSMIILVTLIFYLTRRWEKSIAGHLECSFIYEFLSTIGIVFQHFLPTPSFLWSRRMACFFFVIFIYVTYSFYTSNLLSYIVTDKEGSMNLKALVQSDYELNILENMKLATEKRVNTYERKINMIERKLSHTKVTNISAGLEAVRTSKTALLCDYPTVHPIIARTFDNEAICELEEVDIFSNVQMYFFTAKTFRYKEKLKIGSLRMKEAGIIKRLISKDAYTPLSCVTNAFHRNAQFEHIIAPLLMTFVFYIFACIILIAEIVYYQHHKVWPYVE